MRTRVLASIWVTMFIASILPMIISLWDLYSNIYMHILSFSLPTIGVILGLITVFKAKNKDTRIFSITITFSLIMLLVFEFFDYFLNDNPTILTVNYWTFFHIAAYFSFLGISIDRIIKDYKYITRSSIFIGIAIVSLVTVIIAPILSYSYGRLR